jgi:hypothetical protein
VAATYAGCGKKSLSDDLYGRLREWNKKPEERGVEVSLPDVDLPLPLNELWAVFLRMEQTSWQWPPDVLLRQDDALMKGLLLLRGLSEQVRKQNG